MTFTMPYFSGNLLQRNWDAIVAALNAGGGAGAIMHEWALAGPLPAIGPELVTLYHNNGGVAITATLPNPVVGTDDGKLAILTIQAGGGSTVSTGPADFLENGTSPVGDATVILIAALGQWILLSTLGVTII